MHLRPQTASRTNSGHRDIYIPAILQPIADTRTRFRFVFSQCPDSDTHPRRPNDFVSSSSLCSKIRPWEGVWEAFYSTTACPRVSLLTTFHTSSARNLLGAFLSGASREP